MGLFSSTETYAESSGYYDRIPVRVGEFSLVKNEKGEIIFETTSTEFCGNGPKIKVIIKNSRKGWSANKRQGGPHEFITPSVDIDDELIARSRALWHAAQYMSGNDLSKKERFTLIHQKYNEETAELFKDDAFFKNGDPITTDPFKNFLE